MDADCHRGSPRARWQTFPHDEKAACALAEALALPRPLGSFLAARGLDTPDAARRFLHPRLSDLGDPFALEGMPNAVERIRRAIRDGERIAVFGDYDADGVTTTALFTTVLRALRADAHPFLPHRVDEGYGMTLEAVQRCLDSIQPGMILSGDCGSCSTESIRAAREAGVDVIVTDHHEIAGTLAPATAVVNPKQNPGDPAASLAGVGVAFKLCHALVKALMQDDDERARKIDLRDWLGLVAIGTVADIVPLVGENRILVRHGLRRLVASPWPGLGALCEVAGARPPFTGYHVGFMIGPRLNAAGRVGSADRALELLLTDDTQEAARLAAELDLANTQRRQIEDEVRTAAEADIEGWFQPERHFGIAVGGRGWHIGTNGIVASRLVTCYRRPTVVVGFDENGVGKGSCRSIEGLDILEVLGECADCLDAYGGHTMAAGITVKEEHFVEFKERFNAGCASVLAGIDLRPVRQVTAWIQLGEADQRLLESLDDLRPFGNANPEPLWGVRGVELVGPPRRVGKQGAHLKFTVASGGAQLDAIGFGLGDCELPNGPVDVLFHLEQNTFRGRTTLQLNVRDLAASA